MNPGKLDGCLECQRLQRLNEQLAGRLAGASEVLSIVAERNGLLAEVLRLRARLEALEDKHAVE